jgi:UDP-glucose 4-epimerase
MISGSASRVLLIGGNGFIGHHLVHACLAASLSVRIADVAPADGWAAMGVEYIQGDYRTPGMLDRILDGIDMVVHLAHDTLLLNLDCNMESEFERNIKPAIGLMDACCSHHIKKLLFISSGGTVYGKTLENYPISEDARTSPISLYGTSKLMIEKIGFLYHIQKNLPFVVARPSNAYGPGQQAFRGQGFIATAMASALEGRPMDIFGDGSIIRDYIHARDLANALVALLCVGQVGEAYNVGTGRGVTLRALVDDHIAPILAEAGFKLDVRYTPARGVDVPYNVLDISKITNGLNFVPAMDLDAGLRDTWIWLRSIFESKARHS